MSPDIEWHILDEAGQQTVAQTAPKLLSRRHRFALATAGILGICLGVLYSTIPEPPPSPTPRSTPVAAILEPTSAVTRLPVTDQTYADVDQSNHNAVEFIGEIEEQSNPLHAPGGLAVDRQGNLYVLDGGKQRILKYDRYGRFVLEWGRYGTGDGQFIFPASENYKSGAIAVDAQDNIYVADTGNSRIQKFDNTGKFLLKWSSPGDDAGQFGKPIGVAVDRQGNVYVVEARPESRVQKFDRNGKFLRRWGTWGSVNSFYAASAIAIDSQDFVHVADLEFGTLQIFNHDGQIVSNWPLSCGDERYVAPLGVTLDSGDNTYVTDSVSNRVCKFGPNGRFLAQWNSLGADGGQFSRPYGIAVDARGNIYVADSYNDRVLKFWQPQ